MNHSDPDPVFTLICLGCDAGMDILTEEEAIAQDWTGIEPAFDLPQANYCGLCADCRRELDE